MRAPGPLFPYQWKKDDNLYTGVRNRGEDAKHSVCYYVLIIVLFIIITNLLWPTPVCMAPQAPHFMSLPFYNPLPS